VGGAGLAWQTSRMPIEKLSPARLSRATLARQMLLNRQRVPAREAMRRLLAIQAQEPRPPFLAMWSRLDGFDAGELRAALRSGAVLRVTLLRGTLHLVAAADYALIRTPLQPYLSESFRMLGDRAEGIELDRVLPAARAAYAGGPMTFEELRGRLAPDFPGLDERVLGFATRMNLPLAMVPTADRWGYPRAARFALTTPPAATADPDELVLRYLSAFGPAAAADAQAFTGLRKLAPVFDRLSPRLVTFSDGRRTLYDLPDAPRPDQDTPAPPRFLPDFDNVVLGYADRTRFLDDAYKSLVSTRNLRVKATFLLDGVIRGTWAITRTAKAATLTMTPFEPLGRPALAALEPEAHALLRFAEPDVPAHHVAVAGH
jgi:winged helix DNA-binding protein